MYRFEKERLGDFVIHKSYQVKGDKHYKKFENQVTPLNQATFNVYVEGEFMVRIAGFEQLMKAGQTSLEVALETYPAQRILEEEVLSTTGIRYCIARKEKGIWQRAKLQVAGEMEFPEASTLVVLSGEVNGQLPGGCIALAQSQQLIGNGAVVRCWI